MGKAKGASTVSEETYDYADELPTEEMLVNWREANDYVNEGDDDRPWIEDYDDEEDER